METHKSCAVCAQQKLLIEYYSKGNRTDNTCKSCCPLSPSVSIKKHKLATSHLSTQEKQDINTPETQFFEKKIEGMSSKGRWFSTEEAADFLRIPVGTLRNMTSNGLVPYYKLGRLNRYLEFDLNRLLLSNKRGV